MSVTPAAVPTLDALAARPELVRNLPRNVLLDLALRCSTAHGVIAVALAATHPESGPAREVDELLTAGEAAVRLRRTRDWVYRHAADLPFTVRIAGQRPRFSLL